MRRKSMPEETTAPSERPAEGTPAPDFALASQTSETPIRLSDYRGKQAVVLYFYPKDDTPGCTAESCKFRDMQGEYAAAGAAILGISLDDVESHRRFADKFKLSFPLLADIDNAVSAAYGVYKEKNFYGKKSMGIERTTFVIDLEGKIAKVFPRVKVDQHGDEVLAFLRTLPG
jgi:peroxiredoxin Q/BCP